MADVQRWFSQDIYGRVGGRVELTSAIVSCCGRMTQAILDGVVLFDAADHIVNVLLARFANPDDSTAWGIQYCPFCGTTIHLIGVGVEYDDVPDNEGRV